MRYLVTGCAGFIGSSLSQALLAEGHSVIGIDSFTPYYDVRLKEGNLRDLDENPRFEFRQQDVRDLTSDDMSEISTVFHLAAQPGVRASWGEFDKYIDNNLDATHHLAELARIARSFRIVFASSSSVYGDQQDYPTVEGSELKPRSPYGVTKLAGEALLRAYAENHGVSTAALRFFTVYGPKQRPDMAIQRLISTALFDGTFELYGDGTARRDFTFVGDVVEACIRAAKVDLPSTFVPINVGGSGDTSMNRVVEIIEKITDRRIDIRRMESQKGDVKRTGADASLAMHILGWKSTINIEEGIRRQVEHVDSTRDAGVARRSHFVN